MTTLQQYLHSQDGFNRVDHVSLQLAVTFLFVAGSMRYLYDCILHLCFIMVLFH
jgi:hypothetical protein